MDPKILIVEDEEKLARFIELELVHEGYEVRKAADGRTALDMALKDDYDLILLDHRMPDMDGVDTLVELKKLFSARGKDVLDAGAVDYITKPFAIEELLARIRVALKLHRAPQGNAGENDAAAAAEGVLTWQSLVLDDRKKKVTVSGQEISHTNREFNMLKILLENRDIVLSRDTLLERVCGYDYIGETNIVDFYVRHLRAKIDEAFGLKMIQTVRGAGYVIRAEQ